LQKQVERFFFQNLSKMEKNGQNFVFFEKKIVTEKNKKKMKKKMK